jgi:hypothetical protein
MTPQPHLNQQPGLGVRRGQAEVRMSPAGKVVFDSCHVSPVSLENITNMKHMLKGGHGLLRAADLTEFVARGQGAKSILVSLVCNVSLSPP